MKTTNGRLVFEREDCPLVNSRNDFSENPTRYIVKLRSKESKNLYGFLVWGSSEWHALVEAVNYIRHSPLKKKLIIRKQKLYHAFEDLENASYDAFDAQFIINQHVCYVNGRPWHKFKEYVREDGLYILEADEAHYDWFNE